MAFHYRRVEVRVWRDRKFRALSDRGKLLWLRLLTDPELSSLGVLARGLASLAEDMDWPTKEVGKVVDELEAAELLGMDADARLIVLWNYVRYNPPCNANHVAGWNAQVRDLPECELLSRYCEHVKHLVETYNNTADKPVPIPFNDTRIDTGIETGIASHARVARARSARCVRDQGKEEGRGNIEEEKEEGGCSELSTAHSEPNVPTELIGLNLYEKDATLCKRLPELLIAWRAACPGINILAEIRKAHAWEVARPRKRKTDRPKFLDIWLRKAQDEGGNHRGDNSYPNPSIVSEDLLTAGLDDAAAKDTEAQWEEAFNGNG